MKKRKCSLLQRMMAVLLSAVLVTGMVSNAAPVTVLAQEPDGQQESVSGNTAGTVEGGTEMEDETETEPAEETNPEGQESDDGAGRETQEPDGGREQETPETGTEEKTEPGTVSGNDAAQETAAEPQSVMMAAAPAPQADNIASGDGWVLDADGKLTISSDTGMTGWKTNRNTYKGQVTSAEIQGGVTSIGERAFESCSSLTGITIPESVTCIGNYAFRFSGLTSITIPKGVTSIGTSVFQRCGSLTDITIKGETPPTLGFDVFGSDNSNDGHGSDDRCGFVKNGTQGIHVPEGKAQTYKEAWTEWAAYIADDTPTHTHPVCGASCSEHSDTHSAVEWKALSQDSFTGGTDGGPKEGSGVSIEKYYEDEYRLAPGNYYLTENITADKKIKLGDGVVNLCLGGHTLTSTVAGNKDSISFFQNGVNTSNGTLNLCDCGSGGKITGGTTCLLYVNKGTTANLYGGTLTNSAGHCVIVYKAAMLLLDGATLVTNATIPDRYAIHMAGGSVTIKSGTVESTLSHAVMICSDGQSDFTMEGGTVKTTGSAFYGGPCALYFAGRDYLGNISGGTISGGTLQSVNGPGIHLTNPCKVILSGSPQISGKTADVSLQTVADTTLDGANLDASAYSGQALKATEWDPSTAVGAYAIKGGEGKFTLINNGYTYQYENGGWVICKEHTHAWATTWTTSDTHHWHECSAAGCPVTENSGKDGFGGHVYDNDQDTTCNTCNYTRTPSHTHNYGDWQHNDTQHWKVCACGDETGRADHDFGDWVTDREATATEAGAKHRDCQTCAYRETGTIPATGTSHTHNYGDWQHDDTQHWKVCACGDETGRADHDFGDWVTDREATATEAGAKHRDCQICRYQQTETIPATGTEQGSGNVTQEVIPGDNAPATDISTPEEELKDMLLTEDERQQVQGGTDIKIILEVQDAGNTVNSEDRTAIQQGLNGFEVGQYLNIELYKLIGEERTDITETSKKIRIVITVPDSLKNADSSKTRTFAVIRVHDGRAELLADLDGSADTVTIETDRFSTYAIIYKDTANSGGGNSGNDDNHGNDDDNNGGGNDNGGNGNNDGGSNNDNIGNDNSSSNNNSQNNSDKNDTKPDSTKDSEPKTGDATPLELYATLAMIAGFAYLLLYFADRKKGMTEETKKELVSRLAGWAKRGGKIRKCLALAAVFVLLVYYHSIGKKTCAAWKEIYGE